MENILACRANTSSLPACHITSDDVRQSILFNNKPVSPRLRATSINISPTSHPSPTVTQPTLAFPPPLSPTSPRNF